MVRRLLIGVLSAALLAAGAETPTAEALMEGYLKATGGREAYAALKTQKSVVQVEFVGQGLKGKTVMFQSANGNSIMKMELAGVGTIASGYKDGVSWESSAMQGTRLREGEEKVQNLRLTDLGGAAKWQEHTESAEVTGEENVDGKDCWKVKTRLKGVTSDDLSWVDKKTGLIVKMLSKMKSQMGELPVETYMREYKKFGGILMPAKTEQKIGPMTIVSTIEEVVQNPELEESAFDFPAEVSALLAKKK
jgi:hypothetical protein